MNETEVLCLSAEFLFIQQAFFGFYKDGRDVYGEQGQDYYGSR